MNTMKIEDLENILQHDSLIKRGTSLIYHGLIIHISDSPLFLPTAVCTCGNAFCNENSPLGTSDNISPISVFVNMNCPAIHECPNSAPYAINHGSHCVLHVTKIDNQTLDPSCDGTRLELESNTRCTVPEFLLACPKYPCVDHKNGTVTINLLLKKVYETKF